MRSPAIAVVGTAGLAGFLCAAAWAGTSPKSIEARRAEVPPVLDGRLDERVWSTTPPAGGFTQYDPEEGAAATESTEVRVLYDDRALYVGIRCHDSDPAGIVGQLTRRDRSSEADRVTVQIDSYHDRQTAFVFSVNVSRVQSDGVLSQDGMAYDLQWDGVWDAATSVDEGGWTAEFAIPFSALRFAREEGDEYEWGINIRRYISRKHETTEWVLIPRSERAAISRWGTLRGIRGIRPPVRLELVPYASGKATFQTATGASPADADIEGSAGLDLKYGLSESTTLDAAVNPDFGQVEVDQAVLNLTVFETLFPEKRPFFTEGASNFLFGPAADNTSQPLFFSRRIGKRPTGYYSVPVPPGGTLEANPPSTTILAAGKVSGRNSAGFSFGALAAATAEECAEVRDSTGALMNVRTEPRGFAQVLRVRKDLTPASWIGGIATSLARDNTLPAFSGGVDWNLRADGNTYAVDGYLAGTVASAGEGSRAGAAGRILLSKLSSPHWFPSVSYEAFGQGFNSNDLGFFAQPHEHGGTLQLVYLENVTGGDLRRYSLGAGQELRWNWDGIRTIAAFSIAFRPEFRNFWTANLLWKIGLPAYDDAERGVIGIYRRPAASDLSLTVRTDERQSLVVSASGAWLADEAGKQGLQGVLSLTARPLSWMELVPSVGYERIRRERTAVVFGGEPATVVQDGREYTVFGDRDLEQLNLAVRGIVTFSPALSVQFFGQVLVARAAYADEQLLAGEASFLPATVPLPASSFNIGVFNANVLLRWEYLPGSAVYLVWTQGRAGDSGIYETTPGERIGETFSLPHEDVLLLKATYRLPF